MTVDSKLAACALRIKTQCKRLDVFENIDVETDADTLRAALDAAVEELEKLTGISRQSADFIGAIEWYGSGRFRYIRC
jgi:hypothetical protein